MIGIFGDGRHRIVVEDAGLRIITQARLTSPHSDDMLSGDTGLTGGHFRQSLSAPANACNLRVRSWIAGVGRVFEPPVVSAR